ncbi:hypothetical protein H4W81_007001 [Nonomuraea africana]|uniref:Uncharacterized protein n=1 Tax=Nonomuraea africana TaxID=46171 RepID=A0ABR9KRR1_9ACTN|nr:hypothetical protein [Nonomuraea africana]
MLRRIQVTAVLLMPAGGILQILPCHTDQR